MAPLTRHEKAAAGEDPIEVVRVGGNLLGNSRSQPEKFGRGFGIAAAAAAKLPHRRLRQPAKPPLDGAVEGIDAG